MRFRPSARIPRLYEVLCQSANQGLVCPSNDELKMHLGYRDKPAIPRALALLEGRGWIIVSRYQTGRKITITATGKSTADPANTRKHWRLERQEQAIPVISAGPAPTPSMQAVADRSRTLAEQIRAEAFRRDMGLSDFLAQLVEIGWREASQPIAKAG